METNLKNSFHNILLSTGNVIEYLAGLKSKNLIVPNNRFDQNSNSKYNGLISTLNLNINQYNAVLDEFVVELNGTEQLINKLKAVWAFEDSNKSTNVTTVSEQQSQNSVPQPNGQHQYDDQQKLQQSQEPNFENDVKMDIDDDAYLNQFLEGDVIDDGMESNGLLDFSNTQMNIETPVLNLETTTTTTATTLNFDPMTDINGIDGDKNPADILYQDSMKQTAQKTTSNTNDGSSSNSLEKLGNDTNPEDINLDDLEELLASTNDPNDVTYDSNGVPIDDNNIFDELNYFLGGEEGG